jgi:type VI secretion system protein ImpF
MSVDARNRLQPSLFDRLIDDQRAYRHVGGSAHADHLAMRADEAVARGIRRLSDLVAPARSAGLSLGIAPDFLAGSGGWPALRRFYGLPALKVAPIAREDAVAALIAGRVDLVDLRGDEAASDERVARLEDDRGYFRISQMETDGARVMTKTQFREAVLRDLSSLFNATQPMTAGEVATYPALGSSVLNYGVPPLTGQLASRLDVASLVDAIRQAIVRFEPRVLPETLEVRALESESVLDTHNVIEFEIHGHLWSQPLPIEILLRTKLDLEAGQVRVQDNSASYR